MVGPRGIACAALTRTRSEEHTSELQSLRHLVCRLVLEKKNVLVRVHVPVEERAAKGAYPLAHGQLHLRHLVVALGARLRARGEPVYFFFNDTATTEIYTLSLHDALPIYPVKAIQTALTLAGEKLEKDLGVR